MKKIWIPVFIAFIVIAGFYAIIQGNFGRNFTRNLITEAFQKAGFEVTIDQIEGTLPHQINLKTVTVTGNQVHITIEQLTMRPILWRLLNKEIAFTDVHATAISFDQGTPFNFDGEFRASKKRAILKGQIADWSLIARLDPTKRYASFTAINPLLVLKGQGRFDNANKLLNGKIQVGSDQILTKLPFSAEGKLLANINIAPAENGYELRGSWQVPNLIVEENRIGRVRGGVAGVWSGRTIQGEITADPFAKATVNLEIGPHLLLTGTNTIAIENLQGIHIPNAYGKLEAKAEWLVENGLQNLHLDVTATDFYYGTFYAQKASIYSDLVDPFHAPKGLLDLEFQKARMHGMELDTISLQTTCGEEIWPISLFAEGKLKHPIEIHVDGFWKSRSIADIENLSGTYFSNPFVLTKPVQLEWTKDTFRMHDAEVTIAGATAYAHIDRKGNRTDARIRCDHLPLDFLSINPLDVAVIGTLSLEAEVHEEHNRLQGDLTASIEQMQVASLGIDEKMNASGKFQGHFDRDLLSFKRESRCARVAPPQSRRLPAHPLFSMAL